MELLLQKLLEEKVQSIIQTSGASGMMPKTILNVLKSQACKGESSGCVVISLCLYFENSTT